MLKLVEVDGSPETASPVLKRIAKALDCPVKAFLEPASNSAAQTAELMQLWSMIKHEKDRAKVLSFIRSVAPAVAAQRRR